MCKVNNNFVEDTSYFKSRDTGVVAKFGFYCILDLVSASGTFIETYFYLFMLN